MKIEHEKAKKFTFFKLLNQKLVFFPYLENKSEKNYAQTYLTFGGKKKLFSKEGGAEMIFQEIHTPATLSTCWYFIHNKMSKDDVSFIENRFSALVVHLVVH